METVTTKTSPKTILTKNRGFTLIEIMIVLAILGGLLAAGLPRIRKPQNNVKKVMRELSVLGKEIRDQARMKSMTFRIVFRVGKDDAYWVEGTVGPVIAKSTIKLRDATDDEKKEAAAKSPFQRAQQFFKGDRKLPPDLKFKAIETITDPDPVKQGMAYVYFTAEGMVEKSVIQVTDDKEMTWSLIYNPITGHADILEKAVELKDVDQKF